MFRNYLATALHNLARNWLYVAISVLGLTVAFTAAILIAQFVRNEFSYDRWIPGHQQVYKLMDWTQLPGQPARASDFTQAALAAQLKATYSGTTAIARLFADRPLLRHRAGDTAVEEAAFAWADPDIFKVLPLPALAGNPETALRQPETVVITRRMARKYFGRDLPIGDTLDIQVGKEHHALRVVAVLKDLPSNTVLTTEVFASDRSAYSPSINYDAQAMAQLGLIAAETYVQLAPKATAQSLLNAVQVAGRPETAFYGALGTRFTFFIVPLDELHFHAPGLTTTTAKPAGNAAAAYATAAVGALIVLVASINFVSLMTSRSTRRAVEVGVRKATGARRADLMVQFTGEALIQVACATLLAMALAELLLTPFSAFIRRDLTFDFLHDPWLVGGVVACALIVGLLSAIYPALVLSSFQPAAVLKGGVLNTPGSAVARQALVGVQFAILIGLIVTTATLYRQTQFALREGLGGDQAGLIVEVPTPCTNAFPDEVRRLQGVKSAGCASMNALFPAVASQLVEVETVRGQQVGLDVAQVDFGFFDVFDIHPLAGRLFDHTHGRDSAIVKPPSTVFPSVILNEAAVRYLGYSSPSAALGHMMRWRDPPILKASGGVVPQSPIIGVIPDLPTTVRAAARPTFYRLQPRMSAMLAVRLTGRDIPGTIRAIERTWKATGNTRPIAEVFLARRRQTQYLDLIIQEVMIGICAGIAIVIACLGLFALSAYATERRTKEIGVRKAMGADTRDVMVLLLWQFTIPVLVAIAAAIPGGFLIMNWWLHGFVYHVDLPAWTFVLAAVAAVGIAWLTVSYQSFMVARAKPVNALRYE